MIRLVEKARESLEAAERLLPDDATGRRECLPNASASRAYYAADLAVADAAQREHLPFTDAQQCYYRHDTLSREAQRWHLLDMDRSEELEWLYGLRVKADYYQDSVTLEEASSAFFLAQTLLQLLLPRPWS